MLKKAAPDYNPNTNALVASNPPHTATTHGQTENVYLNMTNTSTNPAPNGSTTSNITPYRNTILQTACPTRYHPQIMKATLYKDQTVTPLFSLTEFLIIPLPR
jgi:hypothetical protein